MALSAHFIASLSNLAFRWAWAKKMAEDNGALTPGPRPISFRRYERAATRHRLRLGAHRLDRAEGALDPIATPGDQTFGVIHFSLRGRN